MLVFVQETQEVYQYNIPNYNSLWTIAMTDGDIFEYEDKYSVLNQYAGGQALQNAWTGSTIEGVSGVTRENARWRIFHGDNDAITGGTFYSATSTLDLYNSVGGTVSISGFNESVTGGTYDSGTSSLTLNNSGGGSVVITGITSGSGQPYRLVTELRQLILYQG